MRAPAAFRGGGRGGGRGPPGGRGGRGGGRGGGGGGRFRDEGPPAEVIEVGKVMHECESEMVCTLSHKDNMIPYFNAGIYLENKKKIGKVDEIFGPVTQVMFTVKPDPGVVAKSFQPQDIMYIATDKLLPLTRFTNPSSGGGKPAGRAGGRGGGGRGGPGGRGGGRGFAGRSGPGGRGGRSPGRGGRGGGRGSPGGRGGRGRF